MNGFMLWMVIAASGQVAGPERDYGWQIHPKDGKLEYIVQISPKEIDFMVSAAKEKASSSIPPEVAARLSRVVVRIGEDPIVSTPIDEVMRLPVVTTAVMANIEAVAGRGKFSQLESAPSGDVLTVAGNEPPPMASTLGSSLPAPPGTTLDSLVAQNTAGLPSGASAFLNDARGVLADAGLSTGKYANTGTPVPGTSPTVTSSTLNPAAPVGSSWPTGSASTGSSLGTSTLGTPPSTYGTTTGQMPSGTQGYSSVPGSYMTNPGYPTTTPGYTSVPQYGSTTATPGATGYSSPTGYGSAPGYSTAPNYVTPGTGTTNGWSASNGNFAMPPRGTTAPTQGYTPYTTTGNLAGYTHDPLSLPSYGQSSYGQNTYGQNTNRVADNRPLSNLPSTFPSTSSVGLGNASALPPSVSAGVGNNYTKPLGPQDGAFTGPGFQPHTYPNPSGMNNVLPVMFVLSLVINFYLGMLIRKLLGRYRSLLSSVRGQAA